MIIDGSPINGVYDQITTPKDKLSDDDDELERSPGNDHKRCLGVSAIILTTIFLIVTLHATAVSLLYENPNHVVDLEGSISRYNSYANLEEQHILALKEIQNQIYERNSVEAISVDENVVNDDELLGYLGTLQNQLDSLKKRQRELDEIPLVKSRVIAPAETFVQDGSIFTDKIKEKMNYDYLAKEKFWPYVGSPKYLNLVPKDSRAYYNSLATFPKQDDKHLHGIVGLNPDGTRWWKGRDKPPIYKQGTPEYTEALKRGGGFYLEMSDHLPLDREAYDFRSNECKAVTFDVSDLPDASIIITFYNEPLSTLLRSVHTVLNTVPPPLLREIILVDDHSSLSENQSGNELDDAIRTLPKVSILRLPHRHGLVQARLAGIKNAQGEIVVILDSHIETTAQWLEPMLARLKESPKSLVYPQIPSIDAVNFGYKDNTGIGCKLSFKWMMQEQSTAPHNYKDPSPIPSASMAGGLFAVYRDFFWYMGGYDEGMTMWGAENVEMPFRYWMCGAKVECMPCSRVYHIYRSGGVGYKTPGSSITINRLRTAYLWLDEFYPLAHKVINNGKEIDIGEIDTVLALKERLKCKDFNWFLDFMEIDKYPKSLNDVVISGQIKSQVGNLCLDALGKVTTDSPFGLYSCHGQGGNQSWLSLGDGKIHPGTSENICANTKTLKNGVCNTKDNSAIWTFDPASKTIRDFAGTQCLSYADKKDKFLEMQPCLEELGTTEKNKHQKWDYNGFSDKDIEFIPPRHSDQWLNNHHNENDLSWKK